jgi:hypothetical protein
MVNLLYAMLDEIILRSDREGHSNATPIQREVEPALLILEVARVYQSPRRPTRR